LRSTLACASGWCGVPNARFVHHGDTLSEPSANSWSSSASDSAVRSSGTSGCRARTARRAKSRNAPFRDENSPDATARSTWRRNSEGSTAPTQLAHWSFIEVSAYLYRPPISSCRLTTMWYRCTRIRWQYPLTDWRVNATMNLFTLALQGLGAREEERGQICK